MQSCVLWAPSIFCLLGLGICLVAWVRNSESWLLAAVACFVVAYVFGLATLT